MADQHRPPQPPNGEEGFDFTPPLSTNQMPSPPMYLRKTYQLWGGHTITVLEPAFEPYGSRVWEFPPFE